MQQMQQMQQMMQMMQQMNQAKGWGAENNMMNMMGNNMQMNQNNNQAPSFSMQNKEEYDAYLKWCEENRARQAEQMKQQELLDQFKMKEEALQKEMAAQKQQMEAKERQENMQSQWKSWEAKMQMAHSFDSIGYEVMEMKHKYYYMVTFEFMKFCKCSDFAGEIEQFFNHDGVSTASYEEFDLSDLGLDATSSQDPFQVAQAIQRLSQGDQIKAFFGGLATSMCEGARQYYNQVVAWENQYRFLERLV